MKLHTKNLPLLSLTRSLAFLLLVGWALPLTAQAQLTDFARDIQPILETRCLDCHGPDLDEAGFNLADRELLEDYLVPGSADESTLYLVLHDEDNFSLMPPEDEGGQLSPAEIALIKLWIDEGAAWPEDIVLGQAGGDSQDPTQTGNESETSTEPAAEKVAPKDRPILEKIWAFHGYFHPAIVHLPIGLLTIGALFIVLHWVLKQNFREFAFYCLALGALSSIAACTMGWAFAPERSMGGHWFDPEYKTFYHRWTGIVVAALACSFTIIAVRARKSTKRGPQAVWQVGLLLTAALVGMAGHQGGELVYGEGIYQRAFSKYFDVSLGEPANETNQAADDEATDEDGNAEDTATEDSAAPTTDDADPQPPVTQDTTTDGDVDSAQDQDDEASEDDTDESETADGDGDGEGDGDEG